MLLIWNNYLNFAEISNNLKFDDIVYTHSEIFFHLTIIKCYIYLYAILSSQVIFLFYCCLQT